jgi:hypothetical protein
LADASQFCLSLWPFFLLSPTSVSFRLYWTGHRTAGRLCFRCSDSPLPPSRYRGLATGSHSSNLSSSATSRQCTESSHFRNRGQIRSGSIWTEIRRLLFYTSILCYDLGRAFPLHPGKYTHLLSTPNTSTTIGFEMLSVSSRAITPSSLV